MNIKHLLPLFAAGAFLFASCTEENEVAGGTTTGGTGTGDDTDRQEVLVSLKNHLVLQKPETKAAGDPIATEEENYIHSLDVYVFGAKEENGDYTLQEIHYYRDDASTLTLPGVNTYSFNLTNSADDSGVTTGLLKLNKGLFIRLYCVANRSEMYTTSDDGTTTQYTDFKSLIQTAPGQDDNLITAGIPKEADFKKLHIKLIDPAATVDPTENDVLASPLPMSGAYITPLDLTDFGSSARTQISFKLSRMVARFDIVNDAAKSKFTLEKMSMGNGQKGAKFFPIETVGKTQADLITYPERAVLPDTQKAADELAGTTNLTKGAFYAFPSPKDDHGYLMLKGKYAVNQTESKDVSYQIPFQQMINGIGTYIEVAYNHRYTITITKADTYHLDVDLKVADWDDKEVIDPYEPENDFDRTENVVLDAANSTGAYVLDNGQISVLPDKDSKFSFKMASNTDLTHEVIYKTAAAKWLVIDGEPVVTKAGSQETTYNFKVDETALNAAIAAGQKLEDVTIRLTNPASGSRKEIKVIATQGPTVAFVTQENNYNTFDAAKLTAFIYNVADQTIKLKVDAETRLSDPADPKSATTTGSTASVDGSSTWLTASGDITDASGEYTLTADGTGTTGNEGTVDFTSVASTAKTTVKVVLKDPAITPLEAGNFNSSRADNTFNLTSGAGSIPQVSLVGVASNSFTLTVVSPEGVTVAKTTGDWLTITDNTVANSNGKKTTTITGTITDATDMQTAAKTDGKFTITNKLDATKTIDVEVVTTVPTAATVSKSAADNGLGTFSGSVATLYNADGQSITLTTDVATTLAAKSDAGFLTLSSGKETTHTITLPAAQSLPLAATLTLTFTTEDGATTEITVALTDPAITALTGLTNVNGTNNFTAASEPDNAKVVMTEATANSSFTLSVVSKEGITIGSETSSWLKVTAAEASGSAGSYTTVVTVAIAAGTDLAEALTGGKIVLANNIPDGGDMTIDVETTIPAVVP